MMERLGYRVDGIFPCPLYTTHRDLSLDESELQDIESIIEGGMHNNKYNSTSNDSYIFNTKLGKIKEFCEQHIASYVEKVISPKKPLEFYITQSWLNVTRHGESHQQHWHPNSIVSGVFYISTVENDGICFHNPLSKEQEMVNVLSASHNMFNSGQRILPVKTLDLILFPSWIEHNVNTNQGDEDRISIAFNVFARGILGDVNKLTELHLS